MEPTALLTKLASIDSPDGFLIEGPHGQAVIMARRHFCSKGYPRNVTGAQQQDGLLTLSEVAVENLEALGLIREVGGFSEDVRLPSGVQMLMLPYYMTALGRFLHKSLAHPAILQGMAAVDVEGT